MRFGIIPPGPLRGHRRPRWMDHLRPTRRVLRLRVRGAGGARCGDLGLSERLPVLPRPDGCPCPTTAGIPDPLDLMAYLAAVTDRIGLATGVLVLPNHQAVVLAKRVATVDVLSGGRVRLCVGVGWMDEELRATGADPRSRGRRHRRDGGRHAGAVGRLGTGRRRLRRRVLLLPSRPLVSQTRPTGRGAHPYRGAQRGGRPPGRAPRGRLPTPGVGPGRSDPPPRPDA